MEENNYQGNKLVLKELKDCPECGKPRISFGWCQYCETNSMKENYPYWTSENEAVDKLIRHTQLNASQPCDYLEWIPFERFEMVKYIGSGGFSSVYSALWMEGPRWNWDDRAQEWTRAGPTYVALKHLDNSLNISSFYIDQIKAYHKCLQSDLLAETFGITKAPTSNYMIVMKYYESGNLYQYLDRHNGILSWKDIINMSQRIAKGLEKVHIEGKTHRNLHGGNLLIEDEEISIDARIGDVGLYGPCYDHENKISGQIYGVLPYVAPEVLRGEDCTPASDIYSFGIIMNTLATGKRPWFGEAHDIKLAKNICDGKRLEIPKDTPEFYANLIQKCWDNEPEKRPTASHICKTLSRNNLLCDYDNYDEKRRYKIHPHHLEIHPEAYYTSRLLYFPLSNMTINQKGLQIL